MSCALDWPTPVASLANPEMVAISLPISQYKGLGFVNFIQGFTFPCGELQSRYLLKVFKDEVVTPSLEEQFVQQRECYIIRVRWGKPKGGSGCGYRCSCC